MCKLRQSAKIQMVSFLSFKLTKTQSEKNVNVLVKEKNENYYSFHDSTDSVRGLQYVSVPL